MLKILQKQNIKLRSIMGAFLGILGIVLLTYSQGIAGEISWIGVGLVMISLIYWGYGSIFLGTAVLPKNQFVNSAYQMITGGLMLLVLSKTTGENSTNLRELDVKAIGSMTFLIVFGSIIAFTSFNYLLQKVPPEKVATGTYLNPVVAVILGYLVLNEILAPIGILASAILLAGVYFINSAKS